MKEFFIRWLGIAAIIMSICLFVDRAPDLIGSFVYWHSPTPISWPLTRVLFIAALGAGLFLAAMIS